MCDPDLRKRLEFRLGEFVELTIEDLLRRRAAERVVRFIHRRQQFDVGATVVWNLSPPFAAPFQTYVALLNQDPLRPRVQDRLIGGSELDFSAPLQAHSFSVFHAD